MLKRQWRRLIASNDGATAVEYGLIAVMVSLAAIGGMTAIGGSLDTLILSFPGQIASATGGVDTP